MQEKFVTSGHDIRIASIKMNYIDKLQRDTQWVQILSEVVRALGPRIMQNHLVRCSTSAKNLQIFT